jgi:spore germination protein GerM
MSKNIVIAIFVLVALVILLTLFGFRGQDTVVDELPVIVDEPETTETLDETIVNLYFVNKEMMIEGLPDYSDMVQPVERVVPAESWNPEEAMLLLLAGLIGEEGQTFDTSVPEGLELLDLSVQDGVAFVDFNEEIAQVSGSAAVLTLKEQIQATLFQFPEIQEIVITVAGEARDDILEP